MSSDMFTRRVALCQEYSQLVLKGMILLTLMMLLDMTKGVPLGTLSLLHQFSDSQNVNGTTPSSVTFSPATGTLANSNKEQLGHNFTKIKETPTSDRTLLLPTLKAIKVLSALSFLKSFSKNPLFGFDFGMPSLLSGYSDSEGYSDPPSPPMQYNNPPPPEYNNAPPPQYNYPAPPPPMYYGNPYSSTSSEDNEDCSEESTESSNCCNNGGNKRVSLIQ